MHPTVADVASPFLPSIRHAKSAPPCKAKTLANAQVFRASTAEIYPLNFTKTQFSVYNVKADPTCFLCASFLLQWQRRRRLLDLPSEERRDAPHGDAPVRSLGCLSRDL